MIGAVRGIAQSISYEVRIAFILISVAIFHHSLALHAMVSYYVGIIVPVVTVLWLISILAELNRTPFDLAEGERELVSGYNTEYSGSLFTMLFISEYLFILVISLLSRILLFRSQLISVVVVMWVLWSRATLPRMRVDLLMGLCWHVVLPASIIILLWGSVISHSGGFPHHIPLSSIAPLIF